MSRRSVPTPVVDREYRARADMHTLREAEEIKRDRARHMAASKAAKMEADTMRRVAMHGPRRKG